MTEKKLAQQLFDAKFASDRVEEEVCEMLWALLGKGGYEDFTFDSGVEGDDEKFYAVR